MEVMHLHRVLIGEVSLLADVHFQGLRAAASFLRRRRLISPSIARRLVAVDVSYNLLRHITSVNSKRLLCDVRAAFDKTSGGSNVEHLYVGDSDAIEHSSGVGTDSEVGFPRPPYAWQGREDSDELDDDGEDDATDKDDISFEACHMKGEHDLSGKADYSEGRDLGDGEGRSYSVGDGGGTNDAYAEDVDANVGTNACTGDEEGSSSSVGDSRGNWDGKDYIEGTRSLVDKGCGGKHDEGRREDGERDDNQYQQLMREAALHELFAKARAWVSRSDDPRARCRSAPVSCRHP